jgi:hypothetical protein
MKSAEDWIGCLCQNIIVEAAKPKVAGGDHFGGVQHGWPGSRWGDKILSPANCGGGSKIFWIRAASAEGFLQNRLFDQSASLQLPSHLHPLLINPNRSPGIPLVHSLWRPIPVLYNPLIHPRPIAPRIKMSPLLPVAVYGLEIPTGELLVPAEIEFPATVRPFQAYSMRLQDC